MSAVGLARAGDEQLHRLPEPLQLDAPDRLELEVVRVADCVEDGGRHHHLAAERTGDDPVGEIYLGAEVVAVTVDRATVMDPYPRLRAVADFEYEYQMAGMNQQLNDRIETVFLMADVSLQPIASKLVKEIARFGGSIDKFVTPTVAGDVRRHLNGGSV